MKLLLTGPDEFNSTDGVIVAGIKYLLEKAYGTHTYDYIKLDDHEKQTVFNAAEDYDLLVVCGTPWLWDSFQNSTKYRNLRTIMACHPDTPVVFMGIGSCLYFKDIDSDVLERPEELQGMKELFGKGTVIVRDKIAFDALAKAGVKSTLLPCPAYFCYHGIPMESKGDVNVLVFQDPTKSISAGDWTDQKKLDIYYEEVLLFYKNYNPLVYCANADDIQAALDIGLPCPIVLRDVVATLSVMTLAHKVLSGRVHCAIPGIMAGADVTLMPLDTRSDTVYDFLGIKDLDPYEEQYVNILQSAIKRKVGTESQRTHQDKLDSGFYAKYMSGNGLDIGYAGYTEGVVPILPTAIGIDLDYPGYDGKTLPFPDNSQDYVYTSHCLEHMDYPHLAFKEWFRVLKEGGHLVLIVPHRDLYEKKWNTPSNWNLDHKRFYTPASLIHLIERNTMPNSYRLRLLEDGDKGYDYSIPPDKHSNGQYEITLVIQKIKPPAWNLA